MNEFYICVLALWNLALTIAVIRLHEMVTAKHESDAVKEFRKQHPEYEGRRIDEIPRADGGSVFAVHLPK